MKRDRCLIIAEAGVNHNGSIELAFQLCDAAKQAGADVVKFQTYKTECIITKDVEQADYQKKNTGKEESQFELLKRLELTYDDFEKIKKYCDSIGIVFASTGDTIEDVNFLNSLGVPFLKIGSSDVGNIPFLRHIGKLGIPVIMSTGMSEMTEIKKSLDVLKEGGLQDIILLHCTSNYPCDYQNVNLKAMVTLRDEFSLEVGYSDHTKGTEVAVASVALGAKVIEKHLTLDKNMDGPDHRASITPKEFKEMVVSIRNTEKALGINIKRPTESEIDIKKVVKKSIVAKRDIKRGQIISEADVTVKRSKDGIPCIHWDRIIGSVAQKDYGVDEGFTY